MFQDFSRLFACLPLACIVDETIFVVPFLRTLTLSSPHICVYIYIYICVVLCFMIYEYFIFHLSLTLVLTLVCLCVFT